jgi:hypothetical protein
MAGAAGGHGSAMQIRLDVASERATTLRHGLKDLRADIKQETAMAQRDLEPAGDGRQARRGARDRVAPAAAPHRQRAGR